MSIDIAAEAAIGRPRPDVVAFASEEPSAFAK